MTKRQGEPAPKTTKGPPKAKAPAKRSAQPAGLKVSLADLKKQFALLAKEDLHPQGWKSDFAEHDWATLEIILEMIPKEKGYFLVEDILDKAGFANALWVAGAVRGYRKAMRLFASHCVQQIVPSLERRDPELGGLLRGAMEVARRHAWGEATDEELAVERTIFWGLLNPREDQITDENGLTRGRNWQKVETKNRRLKFAYLAALAATREDSAGGVWRAVAWAGSFLEHVASRALSATRERRDSELRAIAASVADASREAAMAMAKDMLAALVGKAWGLPDPKFLVSAAMSSVRFSLENSPAAGSLRVGRLFAKNVGEAARGVMETDLRREFLRLCRLKGEYGKVENG
jgi:hypothetical protein